jgi:hypothetical protein
MRWQRLLTEQRKVAAVEGCWQFVDSTCCAGVPAVEAQGLSKVQGDAADTPTTSISCQGTSLCCIFVLRLMDGVAAVADAAGKQAGEQASTATAVHSILQPTECISWKSTLTQLGSRMSTVCCTSV